MSDEETAFMQSIRKKPEDLAIRLVFADWLEEHDDPRGELIRIEEEMKHLTVFSDRYWELKPVRKQLRENTDKKWLKKMGYSASIPYLFGEVPDDYRSRWRILRELAERWWGVPMPDIGGPLTPVPDKSKLEPREWKSVDDALNNPATVIPASMREWMYFVRDLQLGLEYFDAGSGHTHCFHDENERIAFFQRDGNRLWSYVEEKFRHELDPPVQTCFSTFHPKIDRPRLHSPNITLLGLDLILQQRHENKVFVETFEELPFDKKNFKRIAEYFPIKAKFDTAHIFEKEDAIIIWIHDVMYGGGPWTYPKARTKQGLAELQEIIFPEEE